MNKSQKIKAIMSWKSLFLGGGIISRVTNKYIVFMFISHNFMLYIYFISISLISFFF